MKYLKYAILISFLSRAFCVGEAGAIFLLINPGAGPAGTGEAQVAKANDAYASYYNPAGLGFLKGSEIVLQHVNWLPNLADDIFYDFLAFRKHVDNIGTFGGHIIYLNLGEQTQTDELGNNKGLFKSYMMAFNMSYGTQISKTKSIGVNFKMFHQKLAESSVVNEDGDPYSTDFAFDLGYLQKLGKDNKHSFGLSIQNIGPPIDFIDSQQADPAPTNMKIGVYAELFNNGTNKLNLLFDANKLLVGTYPAMDWNGDGIISGSDEEPHNDPWYEGIYTAWLDDWYYGGDYDLCEGDCPQQASDFDLSMSVNGYDNLRDGIIGGYEEIQMDVIQNDPVYGFAGNIYSGSYSYPFPVDLNDADGYCDLESGEVCIDRLLTDISSILPFADIAESYQQYFNVLGFTCGDAMILQTNDNSDDQILFYDNDIDDCGKDWTVIEVDDEADYSIYDSNSMSNFDYDEIINSNCNGFDFNNDGICDCVDDDLNGFCDAFQSFSANENCNDFNEDGLCDVDFNGDGNIDCLDSDNNGYCDDLQYCDQFHYGDTNENGFCDNYYLEIADFSHNDQYLIPTFNITDVLNQDVHYLNDHFFQSGNIHDWFEENDLLATFNGVLQKTEETIYVPNYQGFCDDVFSSYDSNIFSDGYYASDHGNSLCYDQEGDSYYDWTDIPDYGWVFEKNPDFEILSWIDIPHDGLGDQDRYHPDCNDDPANNFYCNGDWIGITEHTYVANTVCGVNGGYNDPDCPIQPTLLTTCPEESGTCNNLLTQNDWNQDGFVDDQDVNFIESQGYIYIDDSNDFDGDGTSMLDIDLDGSGDLWAWYLDSDSDGNFNGKEAHHDLDVDGADQHSTGGYSFNDSKYGYYNAYGNFEKGSGDDRSFSDELEEIIYNLGFEWEYTESFLVRLGFIYDLEGEIKSPTFGAGLKFDKYGFDFGYTAGDDDDARSQTMFLSISLGL